MCGKASTARANMCFFPFVFMLFSIHEITLLRCCIVLTCCAARFDGCVGMSHTST
ncbi:hypothetical protein PR003_g1040 [Phytophthora rubi]|uniref:Uncharacterized protein n=1 Tax=Phytophthora rubi TaxID=129364 RepID=A0A6A4G979_9STRA|nr:hypothetical protein PR002_g964 [Phytophthora rubi]KAE9051789.1 hypothetical protein PR001_g1111 [Phytophthora rubi]KAE9358909.1 hypothetical protein PR003_g1040 [Phytophthora rubi]